MYRLTFQDCIDRLVRYMGAGVGDAVVADAKEATANAYREVVNAHTWSYLYSQGRIFTDPPYSTGTISFDRSTNQVTLSDGVWPSWVTSGSIRCLNVTAKVLAAVVGSTLQLDPAITWTADLPAGTPYSLYRDSYLLPEDFAQQDMGLYEWNFGGLTYRHPREWLHEQRYIFYLGTPQFFTIVGSPRVQGRLELRLSPIPQEARTIDYIYKRRPRPLVAYQKTAGTVVTAAGSTTIYGTGTAFEAADAGRLLRISGSAALPTSLSGPNPPAFESVVAAYTSIVSVEAQDPAPSPLGAVAYTLADLVDIEPGAMTTAFLRCCEWQAAIARRLEGRKDAFLLWQEALNRAREAQTPSFMGRSEGMPTKYRIPINRMPMGPDIPAP